ncbi:MAG TPA: YjgN family protein [Burkholderiales bacterium]|nr:YjgN family protein [Burkholderiales bacterium]
MQAAPAQTDAFPPELKLEFRGSGREYFRVWIVNLCLTLITAGIFSAWAKVRKKRYLYSHTVLDGTPFQYLGQPFPILKGRVVAAVLFIVYYAVGYLSPAIMPFVLMGAVVLAPWVVVRSASFNARYSAFRNMTFRLESDYVGALRTIYWLGLIPALVVGSIFEWWGNWMLAAAVFGVFGLLFPWWMQRLKRFVVGNTVFGGERAELTATGAQFFRVYLVAGLIVTASGVVAGALVAALAKISRYGWVLAPAAFYFGYVVAFAYARANTGNLVWNNTQLGPLRFASTLRTGGLLKLYIANAIGIVLSAGLLIPWAVVRTFKYRTDNLRVLLEGRLDEFRAVEGDAVAAAGAEVGEFFDLDLSL